MLVIKTQDLGSNSDESIDSSYYDDDSIDTSMDCMTIQEYLTAQQLISPVAPIRIYIDDESPPIQVTTFFDTSVAQAIANPIVLPSSLWKNQKTYFRIVDESTFATDFISQLVTIEFFPRISITQRILDSSLPHKDLVVGFDIVSDELGFKLNGNALKCRQFFQPWRLLPNLFTMTLHPSQFEYIRQKLILTSCADCHVDFLLKCPNPLWKNPKFFITLAFKKMNWPT